MEIDVSGSMAILAALSLLLFLPWMMSKDRQTRYLALFVWLVVITGIYLIAGTLGVGVE